MSRPFNVRFGNLGKTELTAVVMSRSNVSVVLTVNNTTYTISLSVVGNDRGSADGAGVTHAGYYGTQVLSGLTACTEYTWSATQSGVTYSGTFTTAPLHKGQDFAVGCGTCFGPSATLPEQDSAWTFLNWYRQNGLLPYLNTFFADDIYYADGDFSGLNVGASDDNLKTVSTNAPTLRTQYDYALWYGMWFGIYGPFYNTTDPTHAIPLAHAALNSDFMELLDNSCFMPSVGDHEFVNNIWDTDLSVVPNPVHTTAGGYNGNGYVVWNQIMRPLSGTSAVSAATNALHWYVDLGAMRYIAADPCTQSVSYVAMLGTNQITDLKNCVNNGTQFFTILGRALGAKDSTALTYMPSGYGYKSENFVAADYNALFRTSGATPKSLMDNPKTNGNLGGLVVMRGDNHRGLCYRITTPAGGGNVAENYYEIILNTMNDNASNGSYYVPAYSGMSADGYELAGGAVSVSELDRKPARMTATIVEVYGSKQTPEMIIRQWEISNFINDTVGYGDMSAYFLPEFNYGTQVDHHGNTWVCCFEKRIVLYGGNEGYDIDETPYAIPQTSTATVL